MAEITVDQALALLEQLQLTTSAQNRQLLQQSEGATSTLACIDIDLTTREITLPPEYKSYLSVANDHRAATIYFSCDRYYDDVDLSKLTIVVEYINGSGESRISPILDYDLDSEPGKIIFGWNISHELTKTPGKIQFAVHIYTINPNTHKYAYSLMTKACTANILTTLDTADAALEGDDYSASGVNALIADVQILKQKAVSWFDLEDD